MNRRELLKFCFAGTFFSGCLFDGLKKTVSGKEIPSPPPLKDCSIIPKQTDIYKILMPLPFNHKLIDEIADMNKTASKYKITGLYNSIPLPLGEKYELFQSGRGYNPDINSIDKYIEYCQHAKDIGINVIYCINSPNVLTKHEFDEINPDFENLIKRLTDSGIKKFKIANTQLLDILQGRPYDIEFQASTSFEYHNVNQYINLLQKHPYITTIDVAIDENKNFSFLASLKKLFPNDKKMW